VLIENTQGIKTFEFIRRFILKLFPTLSYFLNNSFEKNQMSKYYFLAKIQNLCKLAGKGMTHKDIIIYRRLPFQN
jgi:hypothetical protein